MNNVIPLMQHRFARARGVAYCAQIALGRTQLSADEQRRIVDAASRDVLESRKSASRALQEVYRCIRRNPVGA